MGTSNILPRLVLDTCVIGIGAATSVNECSDAKILYVALRHLTVIVAKLTGCVFASVHPSDEGAARMMVFPFANIVDLAADDDRAIIKRAVLGRFDPRDLAIAFERNRRFPEVPHDLATCCDRSRA